jgi:hypothetical protein
MSDDLNPNNVPEASSQDASQAADADRRSHKPGMSAETLQAAMRVMGRLAREPHLQGTSDAHS